MFQLIGHLFVQVKSVLHNRLDMVILEINHNWRTNCSFLIIMMFVYESVHGYSYFAVEGTPDMFY